MRGRAFSDYGFRAFAGVTNIGFFSFQFTIVFNPNFPRHHPFRRIALIHELEHVIDLASGLDIFRDGTLKLRTEANAIAEYNINRCLLILKVLKGLSLKFRCMIQISAMLKPVVL